MMKVPLLDLKAQYARIRGEVRAALDEVLESQRFILGPQVEALEKAVAEYCGTRYAIGVASGTDALLLSLKALGVGPGDSVVTVPFTFFGTAGAIVHSGARPLFVDIEDAGFNLDVTSLSLFLSRECTFDPAGQKLVHRGTDTVVKAILPVHLYGQCADMDEIVQIAKHYHLSIVEDGCQAIGALYGNRRAGSMGDLGCYSFFPSKNLGGTGDGGLVITSNPDLARLVRLLRTHGAEHKYYHSIIGYNSRLDEMQAAVLRVKLGYLEEWSQRRLQNALQYNRLFDAAGLSAHVTTPAILPGRTHIFHQYVIRCRKRNELQAYLKSRDIGTDVYYPLSLHQQKCFDNCRYDASDFPRTREACEQVLALPVFPELSQEQIEYVVDSIAAFYR
jgi:dTDP-4-amino-4,6-dideoxygalactose transaminase